MKCIIFPNGVGGIAIIYPADATKTIEQIAKKDVPTGVKYKIVDLAEIPSDRTYRDAWTADFTIFDGVGE